MRYATDMENRTFLWSVVVIARNEADRLESCLDHIVNELRDRSACVTVILNGTRDRSAEIAQRFVAGVTIPSQAFDIPFADKSNAWNQYVYGIAPEASMHTFVDGYAYAAPGSLDALATALAADPNAHAATGMPSGTPGAAAQHEGMLRDGGLHGSLHALRDDFLQRIRTHGLRIPVGLYRGDGLIGSIAMHNCDSAVCPWDRNRVALVPEATWRAREINLKTLVRHLRRQVNQARGKLESGAIKSVIYPHGFAALPRFADEMLRDYVASHPEAQPDRTDLAGRLALRQLARPRAPSDTDLVPRLLASTMPAQKRSASGAATDRAACS